MNHLTGEIPKEIGKLEKVQQMLGGAMVLVRQRSEIGSREIHQLVTELPLSLSEMVGSSSMEVDLVTT